jgi:hypothetical protein
MRDYQLLKISVAWCWILWTGFKWICIGSDPLGVLWIRQWNFRFRKRLRIFLQAEWLSFYRDKLASWRQGVWIGFTWPRIRPVSELWWMNAVKNLCVPVEKCILSLLAYGVSDSLEGLSSMYLIKCEGGCLWDVAPCNLVQMDRRFRGVYCLHHEGSN